MLYAFKALEFFCFRQPYIERKSASRLIRAGKQIRIITAASLTDDLTFARFLQTTIDMQLVFVLQTRIVHKEFVHIYIRIICESNREKRAKQQIHSDSIGHILFLIVTNQTLFSIAADIMQKYCSMRDASLHILRVMAIENNTNAALNAHYF